MTGPLSMDHYTINKEITKVSPGSYLLGRVSQMGQTTVFIPKYVGRSDQDVNERLKDHANFTHFKYRYASSPKEAFLSECELYHEHKSFIINRIHPNRPKVTNWKCPRCKEFG
ncbi:MAG: hypothetical protein ACE5GH_05770 [Fidelibacterota bacterium]